jgi:hypothetical protein
MLIEQRIDTPFINAGELKKEKIAMSLPAFLI